jgi:hypothetical protein
MVNKEISEPLDKGNIDIQKYYLESINFLGNRLSIKFSSGNEEEKFTIQLENVVSFNCNSKIDKLFYLRLDSVGSSYGLDISIRLQKTEYRDFMVLYLFGDEEHILPVFRALAQNINIET